MQGESEKEEKRKREKEKFRARKWESSAGGIRAGIRGWVDAWQCMVPAGMIPSAARVACSTRSVDRPKTTNSVLLQAT
jgi:hypothetical protein